MDWLLVVLLGFGAYLVGSFPTAYVVVRLVKGVDVRRVGSGNVGALNTYQQVGAWGGLPVLAVDAGKGALAVLVPGWAGAPEWAVFVTTPLVLAGHNWPVFLGFRGGKGAAAILGISLALVPVLTAITLGPGALVIILARNVVLGAAFGFILFNTLMVATGQSWALIGLCASLTAMVTATYAVGIREQIARSIKARRWRGLFTGPA